MVDTSSGPAQDPDDTPAEALAKYVEWMDDMMVTEYGLEPYPVDEEEEAEDERRRRDEDSDDEDTKILWRICWHESAAAWAAAYTEMQVRKGEWRRHSF